MRATKIVVAGLFTLAMMIGALAAKPVAAAPFHATSAGIVAPGSGDASYWHHHHHHHRHRHSGVVIRF